MRQSVVKWCEIGGSACAADRGLLALRTLQEEELRGEHAAAGGADAHSNAALPPTRELPVELLGKLKQCIGEQIGGSPNEKRSARCHHHRAGLGPAYYGGKTMHGVYSLARVEGSEALDSLGQLLADCAGFDAGGA